MSRVEKPRAPFSTRKPRTTGAAGVGPEVGLGEAETADRFALGHRRQPTLLLRRRAVGVDGEHHQRALHRAEAAKARVAALQLLHDEAVGDGAEAGAAVAFERG